MTKSCRTNASVSYQQTNFTAPLHEEYESIEVLNDLVSASKEQQVIKITVLSVDHDAQKLALISAQRNAIAIIPNTETL